VDYCNAVLYGTSVHLQLSLADYSVATRLVVSLGKFHFITPVLRDVLHWLPVFLSPEITD